jgi:hypothetical protein
MMKLIAVLMTIVALAACGTAPVARGPSGAAAVGKDPVATRSTATSAADSAEEFLLASAATDFHIHRPPTPSRFRHVRLGHRVQSDGARQYLLCGEFLPMQSDGKAEWTHFATIRTSGYEQWMGAQAADLCQQATILWGVDGDLSSSLQRRLDDLR